MPVHNTEIARIFEQIADLLEIEEANPFRVRAYRDAARTVKSLSRRVTTMLDEGEDLTQLPGIGEDLAGKIEEIAHTGELAQLQKLKERTPPALIELLGVAGLGPQRVRTLHEVMGITTLDELAQAARQEKIREIEGFGEKTEHQILEDIEKKGPDRGRILLQEAEQITEPFMEYLRQADSVEQAAVAGSYRRGKETVGDLDMVAASQNGPAVIEHFVAYEDVSNIVSQGETRSTVALRSGLQVDLRVVQPESYGAALFYLTGSRAHNLTLRNLALEQDLKLNEYGLFDGEEQVAGTSEEDLYEYFDLLYIVPELREDRGEIDAARNNSLPDLIEVDDLRGDLQSHSRASDGSGTLEEMARAAQERGYEYLAITDHSQRVTVAGGLDAERLAEQLEAIDRLNDNFDGFRLLKSCEVDILEDGALDLADEMLARLDVVVCSVHSQFNLPGKKQTERIIRAMDNPYFNILAHPTGRRLGQRPPFDVNIEQLLAAARERGCFVEINAQPNRLDLNDVHAKMAKEMGVKAVISTDAHSPNALAHIRFGVKQARRAWLEPDDVLNTRSWPQLKKLLER